MMRIIYDWVAFYRPAQVPSLVIFIIISGIFKKRFCFTSKRQFYSFALMSHHGFELPETERNHKDLIIQQKKWKNIETKERAKCETTIYVPSRCALAVGIFTAFSVAYLGGQTTTSTDFKGKRNADGWLITTWNDVRFFYLFNPPDWKRRWLRVCDRKIVIILHWSPRSRNWVTRQTSSLI